MASGDDFERRLDRLFAQAPVFPDAALFAARVQARLDRGDALRRAVIGLVGGAGAAIAAVQVISSGWLDRLSAGLTVEGEPLAALMGGPGTALSAGVVEAEVLWTVAALAGLAIAFAATRLADRF